MFSALKSINYKMEEYELQNGPGNNTVGKWLHNVETACLSDGPAVVSPLNDAPNSLIQRYPPP
jgi:hypothetical protein